MPKALFYEAEVSADPKAAEPDLKDVASYRRRKHKGQKEELLKGLPHEKKLCTLAEEDRFCVTCGTPLVSVGEESVRTEIEFIPAKVRVIDYYRETFECRKCRKEGKEYMEKSPMPYPVIQHSCASPGAVAWGIHQKYELAVPLYRQEKEWENLPVLDAFWSWVKETSPKVLVSSRLGKALQYANNPKEELMNYLLNGNCSISNNLAENGIRPFTIGRKNWLFSGSPKGAEASAGIYTLIETAKANGLNPWKYIRFILSDIPGTSFLEYPEYLEEYMPWDTMIQRLCR